MSAPRAPASGKNESRGFFSARNPLALLFNNLFNSSKKRATSSAKSMQTSAQSSVNFIKLMTQPLEEQKQSGPTQAAPAQGSKEGEQEHKVDSRELISPDAMLPPAMAYPMPTVPLEESKAAATPEDSWEDLQKFDPHLTFIGAGPGGLMAAILAKEALPQLNILLLERYRQYGRKHYLKIKPYKIENAALREKLEALAEPSKNKKVLKIHIIKLEECLLAYAKELGVQLGYKKFTSREELEKGLPQCKNFFGTDGAHSSVRKIIFGEDKDMLITHPMQKLLQISYATPGKVKALDTKSLLFPEILSDFFFTEDVKYSPETDTTTVTGRFFLDDTTFNVVPEGKLKKPGLVSNALPQNIQEVLSIWLNARGNEEFLQAPLYTKIDLSAYRSKEFCKWQNGRVWALFADAAMGFPFFDSFNNAIVCAHKFPSFIKSHFKDPNNYHQPLPRRFLLNYSAYLDFKFIERLGVATSKDIGIDSSKTLLNSSALVSLPFSAFSKNKERLQLHPLFLAQEKEAAPVSLAQSPHRLLASGASTAATTANKQPDLSLEPPSLTH